MPLCSNRPEGFGPLSTLYPPLPTSCFLDTILVPLITWLYLSAILLLLVVTFRRRRRHAAPPKDRALASTPRAKRHRALQLLYALLLIAAALMCVLEIARLALAGLGVGLLPFTIVGIVGAGAVHWGSAGWERRGWMRALNVGFWVGLVVVDGVKVAGEVREGVGGRAGSKYPVSDEVIDVSVMMGVYVVLGVLEVVG